MYSTYYNFSVFGLYPFLTSFSITWGASTLDADFQFDKFGEIDTVELYITLVENEVITNSNDIYIGSPALLSCHFLVVSKKVKNILENFKIATHRFYPAKLQTSREGKIYEGYYLFQVLYNPIEDFDFQESVFRSFPISETYSTSQDSITYDKGYVNKENYHNLRTKFSNDYMGFAPTIIKYYEKYNIACDCNGIWFDSIVLNEFIKHKIFEGNTVHKFDDINGHSIRGLTYKEAGFIENQVGGTLIPKR